MILHEGHVIKALENLERYEIFYYFSTEEYLVRNYAKKTIDGLLKLHDAEVTLIDGPIPSVEEIVAAAGTISFFGTKRIVHINEIQPSAVNDADIKAICNIFESLENAIIVMTSVFKDEKAKKTKKANLLIETCEKSGLVAELVKPTPQEARRFVTQVAESLGAQMPASSASALVERTGTDYFALRNEVGKLAACAQYREITKDLISRMGTQNIEADVFEMVRAVTARQLPRALAKLRQLIDLQNDPIAITAALSGSYIDMYRMKCATEVKKNNSAVFKDFEYRGSDYRLKKSAESAQPYTKKQLAHILNLLCQLDLNLKSSKADSVVLLQTTLCEMASIGGK